MTVQYVVNTSPVIELTTDPVFDICLRLERGELEAYDAARQIRVQSAKEAMAFLAGFIGDDFEDAVSEFVGERDAHAQMDIPEW